MLKDWFSFLRSQGTEGNCSVLVVSDDAASAALIGSTLEQNNYRVGATASVAETLPLLDKMLPDVLICDFEHPDVDGKQLVEAARTRLGKSSMPAVLFLRDSHEDEVFAHLLCVDDMLIKPFEAHNLLASVARLSAGRESRS